ncbi:MAG TPA: TonB-dependent receptor [Verrucomicrobiae bacterium]|nr:TonB-dependent receptor [Verrucomicrobiae bacterium]
MGLRQKWRSRTAHFICCVLSVSSYSRAAFSQNMPGQTNAPGDTPSTSPVFEPLREYKQMSLDELMQQDVTSVAREPQPWLQAPAAIQVVTQEEIHRSGAASIPEALRLADNLDVGQASSSTWNITARGFNSGTANKLLVLMDGRTIYTPLFSGVIWNNQDYLMQDLDRIEVISGPGGTLWGANAVNGVINIVTKDARDTQGVYAEAGGGTWLQDFVGARYGGTLGSNVFFRVYGKYFDRGAEVYADGSNAHDAWNRGQAGFRLDSYASPQNHLTVEGDGYGGFNDVVPGGQGSPRYRGDSSGGHVLGRWAHTFSEESDLSVQLYYDRTHLAAPFQGVGPIPPGTVRDDLDTYDLDFQHRFQLGEVNHIMWGLEYRFTHDVNDGAPLVTFLPGVLNQELFTGFVQDEIKLREDVLLTIGTKLEHNDYTGFEYEPSARLQWNATQRQMLWGAVSRAVRTPSRLDRDLYEPNPIYGSVLMGNGTFRSENLLAYELGYRAELFNRVSGSISGFYNDYSHLRSINPTGAAGPPFIYQNNLHGYTYGFELALNYQLLEWWRLHAGYDLLTEHIVVGPGGDLFKGLGETADPRNQVFFRSSMDLPLRLQLDAFLRWIDTVHNNQASTPGTVPSYGELDVRLAWHATRNLEISLVGQNLIHDRHPEAGYPNPTQEQIERAVYGKVSFAW